ncbi:serine/threonine protein kinase containing TPR domain [Tolypothrix sp. NIES-4075]|uniref:serine/threonine-protein kinase n=1 Tax=Tolypothrix sp. NIES-4075 TaxID=2005459 RepID=UPI000B5CB1CC|nr:serine/threonine-protein kinase [Tolypothrix sp. NIES-4075]GAX42641.1 serine/threonine protein kinase containing TPR domain [Tolypothrix sp. NIES-4075]
MAKQKEILLVGRYKIIKELARGGFGITYLAEDTMSSNCPCVVKQLYPQNSDIIETAKLLFKREVAILKYLQQKQQIPKYFNYFEDEQNGQTNYYLVQEYIHGQPLQNLIGQQWTQPRIINFLREILSILKYLHQINVIHRDIKPPNVMRREEDKKFVLIDFGAVKQLDINYSSPHEQHTQTMIGTSGYAPPEQMAGRPGFYSDIYGLGITAIQLLTKIPPKSLKRDEKDNIIWANGLDIDESLAAILTKMVYRNPEQRYQSVEDVLNDLSGFTAINEEDFIRSLYEAYNANTINPFNIPELATVSQSNVPNNKNLNTQPPTSNNKTALITLSESKLGKITIVVTAIGAIALLIEFIHPFIRPLYYSYQGNRLLDIRQPEKALEEFQNLIAINPNSAAAWKGRGDAFLSIGRDLQALESYNKSLFFEPNDPKTLNNKGKALYKLRRYKEALEVHENVLEINPNNAEAWSGKGLAYIGLREYKEANDSLEKLKQINPDEPSIWQQIGLVTELLQGPQAAKTYYEEAVSSYDDLLRRKPNDVLALTERGSVLLKLNRLPEALASYEKALKIDNNFYEALLGKGNALGGLGKPQEALLAFNRASEIRPQDYQVWFTRGSLLAQYIKDYDEALKSFEKAIERRYDSYDAWVNKGTVLLELNRYDEALVAFDKAKDLQPKDPYVWANRGYTLEKLGRTQEARNSNNKAIELGLPREELNMMQ